jgi:hypothetical protein
VRVLLRLVRALSVGYGVRGLSQCVSLLALALLPSKLAGLPVGGSSSASNVQNSEPSASFAKKARERTGTNGWSSSTCLELPVVWLSTLVLRSRAEGPRLTTSTVTLTTSG